MKESLWAYFVMLFGVFVIVIMMIIRDYQTTTDEDYYLLKEITQAAMIDAVDYSYYRNHNDLRILEEKFAENFLRRFAQSMDSNKNYRIQIFDISENPPKVSIKVSSSTSQYKIDETEGTVDFGVVNLLSAILDMKHYNVVFQNDKPVNQTYLTTQRDYYTVGYTKSTMGGTGQLYLAKLPMGLSPSRIISATVEAETIKTKKEYQNYLVDKLNGVMIFGPGGTKAPIATIVDFPTDWEVVKKYSLTDDNYYTDAHINCTDYCVITYATTVHNFRNVQLFDGMYHDDTGREVTGVYFVPTKLKVTFNYRP